MQIEKELTKDVVLTRNFNPVAWLLSHGFDLDAPIANRVNPETGGVIFTQETAGGLIAEMVEAYNNGFALGGLVSSGAVPSTPIGEPADIDEIRGRYALPQVIDRLTGPMGRMEIVARPNADHPRVFIRSAENPEQYIEVGPEMATAMDFMFSDVPEELLDEGENLVSIISPDDEVIGYAFGHEHCNMICDALNAGLNRVNRATAEVEPGEIETLSELRRKFALELAVKASGSNRATANTTGEQDILTVAMMFDIFLEGGHAGLLEAAERLKAEHPMTEVRSGSTPTRGGPLFDDIRKAA